MNNIPDLPIAQMPIQNKLPTRVTLVGLSVKADIVNDLYKTIHRKSRSTPMKLICDLDLDEIAIVYYYPPRAKSFIVRMWNRITSPKRDYYLKVSELENPNEGPNKHNHIELLRLIEQLSDL
jgi:hypothetical protein